MRIVRAADQIETLWKNGGGVTREIAAWPPGSDLADFQWRVSTATVAADGPFSRFEGVDRILLVLSGQGLELVIDGAAPQILTPASPPVAFPGDVPVAARLTGGTITDLNIMTRRGAWKAEVTQPGAGGMVAAADATLVFARGPWVGAAASACEAGDVAIFQRGEPLGLEPEAPVVVIALSAL